MQAEEELSISSSAGGAGSGVRSRVVLGMAPGPSPAASDIQGRSGQVGGVVARLWGWLRGERWRKHRAVTSRLLPVMAAVKLPNSHGEGEPPTHH